MKKLIVLAAAVMFSTAAIQAQTATPQKPDTSGGQVSKEKKKEILKDKTSNLNLSEEQKAKVQQYKKNAEEKMQAVRNDNSLTDDQKKEKLKSIQKEFGKNTDGVLTPEQREKARQFKENHKANKKGKDTDKVKQPKKENG